MMFLVRAARTAKLPGADAVVVGADTPVGEAWGDVARQTGTTPDALVEHVARALRLGVADLSAIEAKALKLVPEKLARRYHVIPLRETDRQIVVATAHPEDLSAEQGVSFAAGRSVVFEIATPLAIAVALNRAYGGGGGPPGANALLDGGGRVVPAAKIVVAELESTRATTTTARVLIVDDDPVQRRLATVLLQECGLEVTEASDGVEAKVLLGQGGSWFHLVVTDLAMPVMDGEALLHHIRRQPRGGPPIIVLTGSGDVESEARLLEEGADDYIRKPFDPPRFIARVKAVLRRTAM
jgi:CheY-like chemotaxis protein